MNWYANFKQKQDALSALNSIGLKSGDQVYAIDPQNSHVVQYGVVFVVNDEGVWGWWSSDKNEILSIRGNRDKIELRPFDQIAIGKLPKKYLDLIRQHSDDLGDLLDENNFIVEQLNDSLETTAQSMYQLDIPFPADIGSADSERIWLYEMNADNLWWGDESRKWRSGKEEVIQGLPRYNPEYHTDQAGAYFTWWEPYIEPVMYDSLVNVNRSMNAYFFPGDYGRYEPSARAQHLPWEW